MDPVPPIVALAIVPLSAVADPSVIAPPLRLMVFVPLIVVVPFRARPSLLPVLVMLALRLIDEAFIVSVVSVPLFFAIALLTVTLLVAANVTSVLPNSMPSWVAVMLLVTAP